ncbi:hypothetical protein Tco_0155758 [Tanacetum coccineum]
MYETCALRKQSTVSLVISRIIPVTRQGANAAMTFQTPFNYDRIGNPKKLYPLLRMLQAKVDSGGGPQKARATCTCPCSISIHNEMHNTLNFKGTEGVIGLSQWLKKMESNGHVTTLGHDDAYAKRLGELLRRS